MQHPSLSSTPIRRVGLIALGFATALLGACGGGSDEAAPAPSAPAPAPSLSPSDFLATGSISADTSEGKTLLIIDPYQPDTVRLSVRLSASENYLSDTAYHVDLASQTATFGGEAMVYYVKDHQLFQVGLRKSEATVSRRISSLDTGCKVSAIHSQNSAGDDAWVEVEDAGPDGDCTTTENNGKAYVRTNTATTTLPTRLPAGVTLANAIPNADRTRVGYYLAKDTRGAVPRIALYDAELMPVGQVQGSEGITDISLEYSAEISDTVYAVADGSLRRLSWSNGGVQLSPSIYTLKTGRIQTVRDRQAFFFLDGHELLRVAGNGTPESMGTLDASLGEASLYYQTPSSLLLVQSGTTLNSNSTLLSVPKSGGTWLTLATEPHLSVLGAKGEDVLFTSVRYTWDGERYVHTGSIKRIGANGLGEMLITDKTGDYPKHVFPRTSSLSDWFLGGVMWCERAAADRDCRNGSLYQYDTSTGTTIRLGQFSSSGTYPDWYPMRFTESYTPAHTNARFVFHNSGQLPNSVGLEDQMYVVQPGVADSLVRVNAAP